MNFVEGIDRGAADLMVALHRPWLNEIFKAITHLGDQVFLAVFLTTVVAVLLVRRRRRTALVLALTAGLGFPASEEVKVLVGRPRPDVPWRLIALPASPSFPSGHALGSMAVYGTLGLTVGRRLRSRRRAAAAVILGTGLSLLIGFSRVYLGVHYATDVLAGWAGGLVLALLAAWIDRRRNADGANRPTSQEGAADDAR